MLRYEFLLCGKSHRASFVTRMPPPHRRGSSHKPPSENNCPSQHIQSQYTVVTGHCALVGADSQLHHIGYTTKITTVNVNCAAVTITISNCSCSALLSSVVAAVVGISNDCIAAAAAFSFYQ
jgi:hypothetical protein